jgi:integrase
MSHTFTKILKRYNAGHTNSPLPLIPLHGLRHTTASIMIANGVDAVTVSAILGHADTQTTLRIYAHFFEEAKEKALNIMDDVLNAKGRRKA